MKVKIYLAALTRVDYSEEIEVPDNTSDDELSDLVSRRYAEVEGGLYSDDGDYWEKGTCWWEKETGEQGEG
jgi:hypothetical protein